MELNRGDSYEDKLVEFLRDKVEVCLSVEQDHLPVEGNASAIDDETDRKNEEEIYERLNNGDVWAWACVGVKVRWKGFAGEDYLGGCCYLDEADFRKDAYFTDMVESALHDLARTLIESKDSLKGLPEDRD